MKKLTIAIATCLLTLTACAHEKAIAFEELPDHAQNLLFNHFADLPIALTKMECDGLSKNYEVVFNKDGEIEFDHNGEWEAIQFNSGVPTQLIPQGITNYLQNNYPTQIVIKIERNKHDYEVKLNNKTELTFDQKCNLIDIDFEDD